MSLVVTVFLVTVAIIAGVMFGPVIVTAVFGVIGLVVMLVIFIACETMDWFDRTFMKPRI